MSPPTTGTPVSAIPSYSSSTSSTFVSPGAASETTSASGSAPDAARSLRLTAAARQPRSRHEIQSSRKWTPSTSASCVTTRPSTCAASFSIACASPRRSSSASRPSSPSCESLIDHLAERARVARGADHGDAGRARGDARAGVRRVDAADRDHGDRRPRRRSRRARRGRSAGRRRPSTASPRSGRRRCTSAPERAPAIASPTSHADTPEQQPGAERTLGAVVVAAEVDAVGPEPDRRLDVVVDDEHRVELAERPPDARRAASSTRP